MTKPEWVIIDNHPERITHAMQVPGGMIVRFTEYNQENQPSTISMCYVPFVELVKKDDKILLSGWMPVSRV